MYRVLLIDDEPLMLSGIKRLIDWEKNGCLVEGTASNYGEALEKIGQLQPDLVICDIIMPGPSGLELLKQAEQQFPGVVFIMLTNHAEFELARESLHYHAAEYLVKNNLESETLEKALSLAIAEREKRNRLYRMEEADEYLKSRQRQARVKKAAERFLKKAAPLPPEEWALLTGAGMLSRFAFAYIPLNFAVLPEYPAIPPEERRTILDWEMEIAEHLGSSFFPHILLFLRTHAEEAKNDMESLLLFAWGLNPEEWEQGAARFRERLIKTSGQIVRLGAEVIPSVFYESPQTAEYPPSALARMEEQYLLSGRKKHSEAVKKARQYILDNVEKRIMLQEVADHACISPGYLSTLFRKEYNQNLVDFINQVKIDRACELLRENKYRINEISYMLGFENAFYFTRVFHRRTGLAPSEYQARCWGEYDNGTIIGGGGGVTNVFQLLAYRRNETFHNKRRRVK
ncbi:MAG: response regulator [Treponema sp.]|jgi:DNA-binding NarL/FixJ family response regulator/AraC-like DNA-binding protein|nr:response regulator [Treponema sp.]